MDTYGHNYSAEQLEEILRNIYPDLASYLSKYRFKNELLDTYFEAYKYQKLINRVLPSFEVTVEEQATELGFVGALKPRTQLFDKMDLKNAHAFSLMHWVWNI